MFLSFAAIACSNGGHPGGELPEPKESTTAADTGATEATAVFAGGCFWCVEAVFEQLDGVSDVVSGYAGGKAENANYEAVSAGSTGHAEVVQISYNPQEISFGQLLKVFFASHDPTQVNRQGPDWGSQYRSAIFYANDEQKTAAAAYIEQLNASDAFSKPVATTLEPLDEFFPAEAHHQDFVQRKPDHPYIVRYALPKVQKVKEKFGEQVKTAE